MDKETREQVVEAYTLIHSLDISPEAKVRFVELVDKKVERGGNLDNIKKWIYGTPSPSLIEYSDTRKPEPKGFIVRSLLALKALIIGGVTKELP